jgi:hypothetical protein
MPRAQPKDEQRQQTRAELREAFKNAVSGEQRFGIREDCRPELDQRWERVMDLIEKLKR